jgi:hypothetical protein
MSDRPEEVAHIAAAHSGEGELLVWSLEKTIVHFGHLLLEHHAGWWRHRPEHDRWKIQEADFYVAQTQLGLPN